MKYIISTVIVALIIFFVGGWVSGWSIMENAPAAWIIACTIGGLVGSLRFLPTERE